MTKTAWILLVLQNCSAEKNQIVLTSIVHDWKGWAGIFKLLFLSQYKLSLAQLSLTLYPLILSYWQSDCIFLLREINIPVTHWSPGSKLLALVIDMCQHSLIYHIYLLYNAHPYKKMLLSSASCQYKVKSISISFKAEFSPISSWSSHQPGEE